MTAVADVRPVTLAEDVFAAVVAGTADHHSIGVAALRPVRSARDAAGPATTADDAAIARAVPASPTATGTATTGTATSAPARRPTARLLPAAPAALPRRADSPAHALPPTLGERVRALRAVDRSLVTEAEADDVDRGAPPAEDPGLVVRRLATAGVEVVAGIRPAAQLARWVAPGIVDALRDRSLLAQHAAGLRVCRAPVCRAVRVHRIEGHVVEATAVVDDGRRVRAVALRLETHRGAWRATALEIG